MTTKERLKAAIDHLDDADLDELYELVRHFLQTKAHPAQAIHPATPSSSGLCGIWQDERTAATIVEDLLSARSLGRDVAL